MAVPTPSPAVDQAQIAIQKLLDGPARPPPAGVIPNFDNPKEILKTVFHAVLGVELFLTTCAVIMRIYTKRILLRSMGYEDCKHWSSAHCDSITLTPFRCLNSSMGELCIY